MIEMRTHPTQRLMATSRLSSSLLIRLSSPAVSKRTSRSPYPSVICQPSLLPRPLPFLSRCYTESSRPDNGPFRTRLRSALRKTRVEWRPIPITLGIGFLGAVQLYRVRKREQANEDDQEQEDRSQQSHKPAKRKRIRPSGPWSEQSSHSMEIDILFES